MSPKSRVPNRYKLSEASAGFYFFFLFLPLCAKYYYIAYLFPQLTTNRKGKHSYWAFFRSLPKSVHFASGGTVHPGSSERLVYSLWQEPWHEYPFSIVSSSPGSLCSYCTGVDGRVGEWMNEMYYWLFYARVLKIFRCSYFEYCL